MPSFGEKPTSLAFVRVHSFECGFWKSFGWRLELDDQPDSQTYTQLGPHRWSKIRARSCYIYEAHTVTTMTTTSLEVGRGVYEAHRAAALAGVPVSTLHYWARHRIYTP